MNQRHKAWIVFAVLWFCYTWVHQPPGWNQNSRLDLLHALWKQHSFRIDAYHENTGDKSVFEGHYYSDKAPGIVLLALPAFVGTALLLEANGVDVDSPLGWRVSDWVTTAASVGLITALGGVACLAWLRRLVGDRAALLTTLAVFLGSAPFPYATMLFSHAAVMGLLCIALWAIADETFLQRVLRRSSAGDVPMRNEGPPEATRGWIGRYALAGLCCGLAMAGEYPAALASGGILFLAWWVEWRRAFVLALGAVPPLLAVAAYQWVCFGSPMGFGYAHLANPAFAGMSEGFFGITFPPKLEAWYLQWLSPERGLLLWSPFYAAAFIGLRPLVRQSPVLFWTSVAVVVLHSAAMAGYYMPDGGAALGPRLLTPMLPFLTVLAAFGVRSLWLGGVFWGTLSLGLTGLGTLIHAMPASSISVPWLEFYLPRLRAGRFASMLGEVWGLSPWQNVFIVGGVMMAVWVWACCQKPDATSANEAKRAVHVSEGAPAC